MNTITKATLIFTLLLSFQVKGNILFFVKNNRELTIPSRSEFLPLEQKLQTVLDTYHNSYPLTIRVQFIDKEEQGVFESWMEWMGLIDNRKDIDPNTCNDIEILFEWSGQMWDYKGIEFDNSGIIEGHFLPEVKNYIDTHFFDGGLSGENVIISKWLKVITNVLDMQYKQKILDHGAEMVQVAGYLRGHRLAHWMKPDYQYDLEPFSTDSASALTTPYVSNKSEVNSGYYEFMPNILKMFEEFKYHNPNKNISEISTTALWTKVSSRGDYSKKIPSHKLTDAIIKNDPNFYKKDKNDTTKLYRLKLTEIPIADNEKYNYMSDLGRFGWEHTSCNFFAFDLQKKVYGRYLWPLECALSSTKTYNYLPTDANFILVEKIKAVDFAEAGFLVIAVKPGHVTTMYPDGNKNSEGYGYVVQAGGTVTRTEHLNNIWKTGFDEVRTYVYLGHILF